jgi:hypothetical protein
LPNVPSLLHLRALSNRPLMRFFIIKQWIQIRSHFMLNAALLLSCSEIMNFEVAQQLSIFASFHSLCSAWWIIRQPDEESAWVRH